MWLHGRIHVGRQDEETLWSAGAGDSPYDVSDFRLSFSAHYADCISAVGGSAGGCSSVVAVYLLKVCMGKANRLLLEAMAAACSCSPERISAALPFVINGFPSHRFVGGSSFFLRDSHQYLLLHRLLLFRHARAL